MVIAPPPLFAGTTTRVVQPTWRELPSHGDASERAYRNLAKPAPPNILLTLNNATILKGPLGITMQAKQLGLFLDDPARFVATLTTTI